MELQTKRLTICELNDRTAQAFIDAQTDGSKMDAFLGSLSLATVQEAIQDKESIITYVHQLTSLRDINDQRHFGAYISDEFVACAGFTSWSTGTPEIHVNVADVWQHQGIGKEFLTALIPAIFEAYPLRYIVYRVRNNNQESKQLVMALGGVPQAAKSKIEELTIQTYFLFPTIPA